MISPYTNLEQSCFLRMCMLTYCGGAGETGRFIFESRYRIEEE